MRSTVLSFAASLLVTAIAGLGVGHAASAKVTFTVIEKGCDNPVPCRIQLKDGAGKPQRAGELPFWRDHFVCAGTVQLELPPSKYTYECERGPEYAVQSGSFTLADGANDKIRIRLERRVGVQVTL